MSVINPAQRPAPVFLADQDGHHIVDSDGAGRLKVSVDAISPGVGVDVTVQNPNLDVTVQNPTLEVVQASGANLHVDVDNLPATQPVSGTVTADAGTGPSTPWKVDLSSTGANATAVKVDGSAVTQPVTIKNADQIDATNSSTTPLGAGETFTGIAVDVSTLLIGSVTVFAFSDVSSATNGFMLEWSTDGTNWDHKQDCTLTAGQSALISDKVRARYYRVVYTNNATTGQSVFHLQTIMSPTMTGGTVRDLDTEIGGDDEAQVVRSIITGKAIVSGAYTDVQTDPEGNLRVAFGAAAADAFGRGRVTEPLTLFDAQFQYDAQPLLFSTSVNGSGASVSKTANESSITLTTGAGTSGNSAVNQTKQYSRYSPGKSQLVVQTGVLGAQKANVRSRLGYFDANDGVFFEMNGSDGAAVVQRSSTSGSPVDTRILQANWNVDKCDGTGISGFNIDFSKTQIFFVDMQWLGVGRVRFGFFDHGVPIIAHEIYNDNTITSPYMNTDNLPIRAEITNTGTASGATTMKQICMTVISEGGQEFPSAFHFSVANKATSITAGKDTRTPLISIRPKTTFNSITNRARIILDSIGITNTNQAVYWELVYNGTLSGGTPTWTSVDASSGVEFNIDSTACADGIVVNSGYNGNAGANKIVLTSQISSKFPFTLDIGGTVQDVYTLCATGIGGTAPSFGQIDWEEVR